MNIIVVSYSLTGNNRALAQSVAKSLGARHIAVSEKTGKNRSIGATAKDLLFGLSPRVEPPAETLGEADAVILVGPVWMGHPATPLRAYMKRVRKLTCPYAFLTISGGADGPNIKLADKLRHRVKREPAAVVDLLIADLLPGEPKPRREDTSAYKITEEDVQTLTRQALEQLKALTGREHGK